MLRSMTGYGSVSIKTPFGILSIDVQSVNRKILETNVWMSKDFFSFEGQIKGWIAKHVSRGCVTIRIQLFSDEKHLGSVLPEISFLQQLKEEWLKKAKALHFPLEQVTLPFLVEQSKALEEKQKKRVEDLLPFLEKGVDEALVSFTQMKDKEGKALEKDILKRLKEVEKIVHGIEKLAPRQVETYKTKLTSKLSDFLQASLETKDLLLREILLFSDKVDISEELVRFFSHVSQFFAFVKDPEMSKGKKLDFILQELNREIHTMGSKSQDADISHLVVEAKSELEKIREQLQNVE